MNRTFAGELTARIGPELQARLAVASTVPLQIKLQLERLRLAEIVRAADADRRRRVGSLGRPRGDEATSDGEGLEFGAGERIRTVDPHVGNVMLYP